MQESDKINNMWDTKKLANRKNEDDTKRILAAVNEITDKSLEDFNRINSNITDIENAVNIIVKSELRNYLFKKLDRFIWKDFIVYSAIIHNIDYVTETIKTYILKRYSL
jgi:hypothetical protein